MKQIQDDKTNYPHATLTKKIIGAAFAVYNSLGYGYPERVYQKAFAHELDNLKLGYEKEKYAKILYDGQIAGRFFLDFLVDNKVAVELKVRREIYQADWIQILHYLKATDLKIGILLVFAKSGVLLKRLIR